MNRPVTSAGGGMNLSMRAPPGSQPRSSSPSEGSGALHQIHQRIIADQAFALNVPVETR